MQREVAGKVMRRVSMRDYEGAIDPRRGDSPLGHASA